MSLSISASNNHLINSLNQLSSSSSTLSSTESRIMNIMQTASSSCASTNNRGLKRVQPIAPLSTTHIDQVSMQAFSEQVPSGNKKVKTEEEKTTLNNQRVTQSSSIQSQLAQNSDDDDEITPSLIGDEILPLFRYHINALLSLGSLPSTTNSSNISLVKAESYEDQIQDSDTSNVKLEPFINSPLTNISDEQELVTNNSSRNESNSTSQFSDGSDNDDDLPLLIPPLPVHSTTSSSSSSVSSSQKHFKKKGAQSLFTPNERAFIILTAQQYLTSSKKSKLPNDYWSIFTHNYFLGKTPKQVQNVFNQHCRKQNLLKNSSSSSSSSSSTTTSVNMENENKFMAFSPKIKEWTEEENARLKEDWGKINQENLTKQKKLTKIYNLWRHRKNCSTEDLRSQMRKLNLLPKISGNDYITERGQHTIFSPKEHDRIVEVGKIHDDYKNKKKQIPKEFKWSTIVSEFPGKKSKQLGQHYSDYKKQQLIIQNRSI